MTTESTKVNPAKDPEETAGGPKVGTDEQIEGNGTPPPPTTNTPNGQIEGNSVPTGKPESK